VQEDLVDAELELGRHADLVPELEELVARHPFDERARAQLMLALYRSGRQADALEAFQEARRTLDEELGLEPSAPLRELERAILMQEPSLVAEPDPATAEERRKTVTVVSAGLTPTELADPELLRASIVSGVAAARAAIERHEGWVTTRAGDELLGVFGVPVSHEDDALRAARAAAELREAIEVDDLPLELRIGIDTGEALTGHGFVSGDVLRLAGHLQRTAASGEIVLGDSALTLVRHGVEGAKRKGGFRLAGVKPGAPVVASHADVPLVGRDRELAELEGRFEDACKTGRPQLVALTGDPGIGKSRLARELVARLEGEATALVGRCVAYGEGGTYLPLRELVSGIDFDAALAEDEQAELVARRVAELVGLAEGPGSVDEGFWAMRRLLSALASSLPLVLVLEDLHWADAQLLDFVDQVVERASGPMLVLGTGRPELLDERGTWHSRSLVLERLSAEDTLTLAAEVEPGVRARIVDLAEGNPLFAEQLLAYAQERGEAALEAVPPSVEALLAARLDLLEPDMRGTVQRAALIGREFSRAGLVALSPPAAAPVLSAHVLELVRRGFVHPERAAVDEERYRFHHALVRDVAYAALPKGERAELHEAFADWLGERPDALDETVGYHLEQAYRYRTELAPADRRAKQLATDAGGRLGSAGMRAWRRNDIPATIDLVGRATSLLPEDHPRRRELLCELGVAFEAGGDTGRAQETLERAVASADSAMDARVGYRGQLELAVVHFRREPEGTADALLEIAREAIPVLEHVGDDRGLGRAWLFAGWVHGGHHGRHADWEEAAERALEHYRRAGFPGARCLGNLGAALYYGPAPVWRAVARCEALLAEEADRVAGANVMRYLGGLTAMAGPFDQGRELIEQSRTLFEALGQVGAASYCDSVLGDVELLAGNVEAATRAWRALVTYCNDASDFSALSTTAADLADALYRLGEYEEAGHWSAESERHAATDDIGAQFAWRAVRAKVLARREEFREAEALAREALRLAEPTDALNKRANVQLSLAEVLGLAGQRNRAASAIEEALRLYEAKGNLVESENARRALAHMAA